MTNLRVVSLQAANVLRLAAVEFEWDGAEKVLTLGGMNGAGKSSVLNAVAMALGGLSLCPAEPLKRGETRGHVELNLGELVVRREFWRDLLAEQPDAGQPPAYGETKSRLVVKNAEGIKQEPAQQLLNRLVGKLTFDPMQFVEQTDKQSETLRKLVGLDFTAINERREIAYQRRTIFNKEHREKLVLLDAMTPYEGVPLEPVSLDNLTAQLKAADAARELAAGASREAAQHSSVLTAAHFAKKQKYAAIADLDKEIQKLQEKQKEIAASVDRLDQEIIDAERQQAAFDKKAADLLAAVPDVRIISDQIQAVNDTNDKIRANQARHNVMNQVIAAQNKSSEQEAEIQLCDDEKARMIRDAKYPVEGLSIAHDGAVLFNGIPFAQASTAEQIRVSVAIGFALNPTLKLLCVHNGNALDRKSRALLAEAADAYGGQVLMEIVTENAADVSVFIEDGRNA